MGGGGGRGGGGGGGGGGGIYFGRKHQFKTLNQKHGFLIHPLCLVLLKEERKK